jgi:hypothetical protein
MHRYCKYVNKLKRQEGQRAWLQSLTDFRRKQAKRTFSKGKGGVISLIGGKNKGDGLKKISPHNSAAEL